MDGTYQVNCQLTARHESSLALQLGGRFGVTDDLFIGRG